MNKEEFTSFISKHFVITKKAAEETINMFTGAVIEAVRHKESVNLVGFESFYAIDVK